jgi:hypothetical protein
MCDHTQYTKISLIVNVSTKQLGRSGIIFYKTKATVFAATTTGKVNSN